MNLISTLAILSLFAFSAYSQNYGTGPILGILTIPSEVSGYDPTKYSYFPSSYVKFIESGGAQVVPIPYDLPQADMVYLLDRLNGVLFTGGDSTFVDAQGNPTTIATALEFVVSYVIDQNMEGNYYPLWGTCQGFEVIAMILARNFNLLTSCTGCAGVNKNNFLEPAYSSKLWADLPADLEQKMNTANISYFNEDFKLDIAAFQNNVFLSSVVTPASYTYDAANIKYVSSYESPYLPIYATQFHQEKAAFEWVSAVSADHSWDAITLQEYLANFLVNEARKNNNYFETHQQYLIDNYNVTILSSGFSSVFLFPAETSLQIDN